MECEDRQIIFSIQLIDFKNEKNLKKMLKKSLNWDTDVWDLVQNFV